MYYVYLGKSLSSILFRDKALGDEPLERREKKPKQGDVFSEQACSGNAARVEGSKGDAGVFIVPPVELLHGEHVTHFAVFVRLGSIKIPTINHG